MAEGATIGAIVRDGHKPTDNWVGNGLKWLEDIQEYYRERVTMEKEYGQKLQQLAKKYQERRIKKTSSLSVGDNPAMTPGSLENASMTTWARVLDDTKEMGKERVALAEEFRMQVAEPVKGLALKGEDFRKRYETLNTKLIDLRDKTYGTLRQQQKRYYETCTVMEKERAKGGGATKKGDRATTDMNNAKNAYIIAINCANGHKRKYYYEDVPAVLDGLQDVNQVRVQRLNMIWKRAGQMEQACMQRQMQHIANSNDATDRNTPVLDSNMFIQHNQPTWTEPVDFGFEPCPVWHDVAQLADDDAAKVYLQNDLTKARRELSEVRNTVSTKRRELDGLERVKQQYIDNPAAGNVEETLSSIIFAQTDLAAPDNRRQVLEHEVATVTQVLGNIDAGLTPHAFKSTTFAIPTNCDLCGHSIWGLNAKGYHCKACDYHCHKACQMKVPANCTGVKGEKKSADGSGKLSRTDTVASTADSIYGVGKGGPADSEEDVSATGSPASSKHRSSFFGLGRKQSTKTVNTTNSVAGAASSRPTTAGGGAGDTAVLFDYTAATAAELSIKQGQRVVVLAGDDGHGWIQVKLTSTGASGLVPGGYVQDPTPSLGALASNGTPSRSTVSRQPSQASVASELSPRKQGPPVAAKRGGKKVRQCKVLYDYDAQADEELSLRAGQILSLTQEEQGDGWATGEIDGRQGIFPQAYTELI